MNTLITLQKFSKDFVQKEIAIFEEKFLFEIPLDFKNIMLHYNVCKPINTFFKKGKLKFNLNYFLGFSENKYKDLTENCETYLQRMPEELFPIASVDGEDLLCMNKYTKEVFYWFHEEDDWGLEGIDKWPTMVASNLEEYINQLILPELPSQQEIEIAKKNSKVKMTPISVKIKNEQREKQGLPPLSFEEWDALLNG